MDTKAFRTSTFFTKRANGQIPGIWEVALDIGYSAVKIFSPNIVAEFPSYARRVDSIQYASKAPKESILYRDKEKGETWLVGQVAQDTMESGDTNDSESSLYGRDRYYSPMFEVIAMTGLGIACTDNEFARRGNDKIYVQTGLPERYMSDKPFMIEILQGHHQFELRIGSGDWISYDLTVEPNNIDVMSQPKGTLFSICIERNGQFHPDAGKYLSSSLLVFDPGFGTLDVFPILSGVVGRGDTFADLGMKRVLQETSKLIADNLHVNISVPLMQKALETGTVRSFDIKTFSSSEHDFSSYLEQASAKVCDEALDKLESSQSLLDYNYLVITGGTGAAWDKQIHEKFKNFDTLHLIEGTQNDVLPATFSNVRGYYLFRYNKLGKEYAAKKKD
jgi:plasmid segregation protein ParM